MGVDRKASAEEIKNGYRNAARNIIRTFPRKRTAEEKFKELGAMKP